VIPNIDDLPTDATVNPVDPRRLTRLEHVQQRTDVPFRTEGATPMFTMISMLISQLATRLRKDDRGEVSLEYVLVGGLAAVFIIAGMAVLSPAVGNWFSGIADTITDALPAAD
jgi:Flp pilus assembly pilin Flp